MKKIGILIPAGNYTIEDEVAKLYETNLVSTDEVIFYTARVGYKTRYSKNKKKYLEELANNSLGAFVRLEKLHLDDIGFFCTSSAILNEKKINKYLSPETTLIQTCKDYSIDKALLITPYNDYIGNKVRKKFIHEGIAIKRNVNMDLKNSLEYYNFGYQNLEQKIMKLYNPEYNGIIISCTNLPTLTSISSLTKKLNTKITSSNHSMFRVLFKRNKVHIKRRSSFTKLFIT